MSNTKYEYIFDRFKDNITDPDLILFSNDIQTEMLIALLNNAISKCARIVKPTVNLYDKNDELMEFSNEIPDEVIDILIEWMTVKWLSPYVNNLENLRSNLNTKDFTYFSPANLLDKVSDRYESAIKNAKSLTNQYSYIIADMGELKT